MQANSGWNTAANGNNAQANAGGGAADGNVPPQHNAQHDVIGPQAFQAAGTVRFGSKHALSLTYKTMRPDDWAHTTETTVDGMNAGYVHGIVRDMNNGKTQGPVRVTFESTECPRRPTR